MIYSEPIVLDGVEALREAVKLTEDRFEIKEREVGRNSTKTLIGDGIAIDCMYYIIVRVRQLPISHTCLCPFLAETSVPLGLGQRP